jgi:hypothetical protein
VAFIAERPCGHLRLLDLPEVLFVELIVSKLRLVDGTIRLGISAGDAENC